MWKEFVSQAEAGGLGEVIAIDLPGFGAEPAPNGSWGIPEYAIWAKKKIDGLGRRSVILVGHSFGGRIAGVVASQHPSWLVGLVLYGAPSLYRPKLSTRMMSRAAKVLKKIGVRGKYPNEELREAEKRGMGAIFRRVVVFDETSLLPKIAVPTLLVWGELDNVEAPVRIAKEMQSLISGSSLVIMDKVGHNAHLENPALFYGIIKHFKESL
jgi:pimeloyl-ACP methyl ester carboxylesterase